MLEKIGLPAKPSQRGNNWVVDASHCQGCSSQFTFINRKHHCRRCGGLFCNSCTQQRMVLRGQGDSPVRICDPCKKLEEAARFEMRYGHRNRAGRGGSKSTLKSEDEVLNQILGDDRKEAFASSSKSLNAQDVGGGSGVIRSPSTDEFNHLMGEKGTASPEDLRQKALEEKQKYKVLKGEGKPDEALKAFKRGKELERQADALEISLRRSRRNALRSASVGEVQSRDVPGESRSRSKVARLESKEKDDLAGELRELGWSDMDLHNEEKKGKNMTLEGELSSLLGEISDKPKTDNGSNAIDKTQVIALKKKALALKREGKMAEAKEELKKAKILEKQLEEQEFLAEAEDSDDELSELIRSLDGGKKDLSSNLFEQEQGFDFGSLLSAAGDQIIDGNFDATEDDMEDPEIAAALKSLGWTEDSDNPESIVTQIVSEDKESLSKEILSLKREAVSQKRAGNISEAMALLKKEKLLERDLEVFKSHEGQVAIDAANSVHSDSTSLIRPSPRVAVRAKRSKGEIQRELLNLKRKALSLRRKGETEEADEVLKMAKVLEVEMEELEAPKQVRLDEAFKEDKPDSFESLIYQEKHENPADDAGISGGKSQATSSTASKLNEPSSDDMEDPEIAAALKSLGWTEDSDNPENTVTQVVSADKESLSKEILSLKREAVSQKRAGNISEAMALLKKEKLLERDLEGFESHDRKVAIDAANSVQSDSTSLIRPSPPIDVRAKRSKGEIQRELLNLKRKALALRRKGETEEAEEVLKMAKVLEAEMEELEAPKQVHLDEAFKEDKPDRFGSLINQEKHENPIGDAGISGELSQATPSTASKLIEPSSDIGSMESDTARHALLRNSDISNPLNSRLIGDQMSAEKQEDMVLGDEKPRVHESNTVEEHPFVARKDDIKMEKRENMVLSGEKQHVHEANSSGENASQNNESSLKQDILTRKRKAVALKREGKLAEAREELRQAKLLEKSLEKDDVKSKISPAKESVSTSNVSPVGQKERRSSNTPPKPISSRDRFKLQQESLAHKRQALKLRREGRSEEAEAEFELAKALETQLEELSAQDSSGVEPENDVGVEDFLDPQLLSALRAIGIDNTNIAPRIPDRPSSKPNVGKIESANQERTKLEEQIKAEKVKALNLKRSGRQAEALDALRTAKLLEKKMNSLS